MARVIPPDREFQSLQIVQLPAGGMDVELRVVHPALGVLDGLTCPIELPLLAIEALLGRCQLALGRLAALRQPLTGAALRGLPVLSSSLSAGAGRRRGGADQPDRRGPLLAGQTATFDRLGDLGV